MPGKQTTPNPTQGELAILHVLWEQGPSTVRAVWEKLEQPGQDRVHHGAQADADHGPEGAGQPG
jgi:hypothetical protein